MRLSVRTPALVFALLAGLLAAPGSALAGPGSGQSKERIEPAEPSMSREVAIATLREGEAMLDTDRAADGLTKMLDAYAALETLDGPEAAGVKELRSWLVKALETVDLPDEAALLRQRGSYVEHPLSVMPSTWFSGNAGGGSTMNLDDALAGVERGLGMLERGDVEGLALLLEVYAVVEREQGAESEDAQVLRSFLVGLLETGGFTDEAAELRQRGSVVEATPDDIEVYSATWLGILEAEQGGASVISGGGGFDKGSIGAPSSTNGSTGDSGASGTDSETVVVDDGRYDDDYNDYDYDYRPKVVQAGSAVPSVAIDLGLGSFQPDVGTKGWIWTLGLEIHWTLFHAKFFSMQLGGAGRFGRNRDKRWLTDAWGRLGFAFNFEKVYIIPEFGGGYDGVAGGDRPTLTALRVAPAAFYQFGGTLGVNFGERFGMYGRAVRLNRADSVIANETRVRGGFLIHLDKATLDLAFVFTDYEAKDEAPAARLFTGVLGFRF